ncbi:hypothetical protein [Halocatena halophila]|uniref:hypothetical protein n=1 Tax=Halocatena halophila TaxID=2814576 RepID=UPI002ED2ED06
MSFRLSKESRSYYNNINKASTTNKFESDWDKYYLSAMAGIKARNRVPDDEEPPAEQQFVDYVIQNYDDQKYEIYGSLIVAEIEREGIPWGQKEEIRQLMLNLLDSSSNTRLSEEGIQVLNCYAEKGFRLVRSEITPQSQLDEFLELYYNFLNDL